MTTKATALATSVSVVCLYVLSLFFPNDPYFYFISSNLFIGIARMLLAGFMIYLATKRRYKYKNSNRACSIAGLALVVFGIAGIFIAPLDYALFNVIKPFDYLYSIGAGFYIGYYSLALKGGRRRFTLPRLSQDLSLRLAARFGSRA